MKKIYLTLMLLISVASLWGQRFSSSGTNPILVNTAISLTGAPECAEEVENAGVTFLDVDGVSKTKYGMYYVSNTNNAAIVVKPSIDFDFMPFEVYGAGTFFYPDTSFNLRTYANVTLRKTYYVNGYDSGANDTNDGLSWESALKTLSAALAKSDVGTIYATGYFHKNESSLNAPNGDVEIIGVGECFITSDHANVVNNGTGWTFSGNTWSKTVTASQFTNNIFDRLRTDKCGYPFKYLSVANPTEVDATNGSYYVDWSGTFGPAQTIYINTIDNREPGLNIALLDNLAFAPTQDNRVYYFKNVTFLGSCRFRNNSTTGGLKVYLENCALQSLEATGVNEVITWKCINSLRITGDVLNYDERNGIGTKFVEYGNILRGSYSSNTSSQISTAHGTSTAGVRIWCNYNTTGGQIIADVTGSTSWNLGINVYKSNSGVAFYTQDNMWLHGCNNQGISTDFDGTAAGVINIKHYSKNGEINGSTSTLGAVNVSTY